MCVVNLLTATESMPPMAVTAPMIVSLSVVGMSAAVTTTSEKIMRGSGVYGRSCACLPLASEAEIHFVRTTGTSKAFVSVYSGKSIVFEIMCVICARGSVPSRLRLRTSPPDLTMS